MTTFKKHFSTLLLVAILCLGFAVRMYHINSPIADWHSWRQVDTVSVTKFLLKDGQILYPKYFDISKIQTGYENAKGYRFVEFPIFNIIHAFYFTVLPISFEAAGRLVSITAAIITAVSLYFISEKISNKKTGLFVAFFYLTMPYNIYFTRVTLPDPLATMFGIFSIYLFLLYAENKKIKHLYASSIVFALALLTKPNAIFFSIPIFYIGLRKTGIKKLFTNIHHYIALDIAIIPMIAWRGWMYYGDKIVGIPFYDWLFNGDGIRFKPSFWRWIFGDRIGKLMLGFFGLIPFGIGSLYKKTPGLVHMFLLASFAYVSVFATANVKHDYYQIFIFPSIALATGFGFSYIFESKFANKLVAIVMSMLILGVMYSISAYYVRDFYKINNTQFFEAADKIQEITPEDALVIAPDNGNTVFLYHTNRMGWPVVTTDIDSMIKMGADYYVSINKNDADTSNFKSKFATIAENDNYIILDLHNRL